LAHHKSAIKRIKQTVKKTARNRHVSSTLKTYIKRVREAVEAKDKDAAVAALKIAIPVIDTTATKGVIQPFNGFPQRFTPDKAGQHTRLEHIHNVKRGGCDSACPPFYVSVFRFQIVDEIKTARIEATEVPAQQSI